MVFDARTGALKSVNRETRRLFSGLHEPDRPVEELLGIVTVRSADDREVSLEEFSMAQALSADETVRVEFGDAGPCMLPDGRERA